MSGTKASDRSGNNKGSKKNGKTRRARLNKRLAAYSAMAAGVVGVTGESADATVVVHQINLNVPFPSLTLIDIDGGIAAAFASPGTVSPLPGSGTDLSMINYAYAPNDRFANAFASYGIAVTTGSTLGGSVFPAAIRFTTSQRVGTDQQSYYSSAYLNNTYPPSGTTYPGGAYGNWAPGDRGVLGLAFDISGNFHFGWVDLTFELDGSYTIHRVGYEDVPDTPAHVTAPVPEPATFGLGMLALGAVGVSALKRRREAEAAA